MSAMSSGRPAPAPARGLVIPAGLGLAIAAAVTLFGPLDTALDRAPFGLLGGASFAFGGVIAWAIGRWRAR